MRPTSTVCRPSSPDRDAPARAAVAWKSLAGPPQRDVSTVSSESVKLVCVLLLGFATTVCGPITVTVGTTASPTPRGGPKESSSGSAAGQCSPRAIRADEARALADGTPVIVCFRVAEVVTLPEKPSANDRVTMVILRSTKPQQPRDFMAVIPMGFDADLSVRFVNPAVYLNALVEVTGELSNNGALPSQVVVTEGTRFRLIAAEASRVKWNSTSFVYAATIFTRPAFMNSRVGAGVITAKAGDGALRQEWVFEPTDVGTPEAYYTPPPGSSVGPMGHHVNELAAAADQTGEFGAFRVASGPRLRAHWPERDAFAERELGAQIDRAQTIARAMPRTSRT